MTRNIITGEYTFSPEEFETIAHAIADRCRNAIEIFRYYSDDSTNNTSNDTSDDTTINSRNCETMEDYYAKEYLSAAKLYKEFFHKDFNAGPGVTP